MFIGGMMLLAVWNCLVFLQNALLQKAFQYGELGLPPLACTARAYKTQFPSSYEPSSLRCIMPWQYYTLNSEGKITH